MEQKAWYEVNNIDEFDSPALLVYPERLRRNIQKMVEIIPPERLRPHVKTNKLKEVCQLMIDAGITKFKCATIAEAEMLGMVHAPDVLLAYAPTLPKSKRLVRLIRSYPKTVFACLVDHFLSAEILSAIFASENIKIQVWIDINAGMNRTGILPENAVHLFRQINTLPNLEIVGLHVYDGHIKGTDFNERKKICDTSFVPVLELRNELQKISGRSILLVAGGSPTSFIHEKAGDRECSPGTFVFWDKGYTDQLPEQPFEWAALVACRIISIPGSDLICVDLGYKSVASENPFPRVYFLNAPNAVSVAHSEEHLVLKVPDSGKFLPGNVLYGVPWHICPTVALYDKALIVEKNFINGFWNVIARKREITI